MSAQGEQQSTGVMQVLLAQVGPGLMTTQERMAHTMLADAALPDATLRKFNKALIDRDEESAVLALGATTILELSVAAIPPVEVLADEIKDPQPRNGWNLLEPGNGFALPLDTPVGELSFEDQDHRFVAGVVAAVHVSHPQSGRGVIPDQRDILFVANQKRMPAEALRGLDVPITQFLEGPERYLLADQNVLRGTDAPETTNGILLKAEHDEAVSAQMLVRSTPEGVTCELYNPLLATMGAAVVTFSMEEDGRSVRLFYEAALDDGMQVQVMTRSGVAVHDLSIETSAVDQITGDDNPTLIAHQGESVQSDEIVEPSNDTAEREPLSVLRSPDTRISSQQLPSRRLRRVIPGRERLDAQAHFPLASGTDRGMNPTADDRR